jgi:hypothetical protein
MRIAPILWIEEEVVLFAGMRYVEGRYHRKTQILSQINNMLLFTGLVLFRGVLLTVLTALELLLSSGDQSETRVGRNSSYCTDPTL